MILRCRTCGKDNSVADLAESYVCEWCQSSFTLNTAKVIEQEQPKPSDPLGDFR